MKLATLHTESRDGRLVVVSADGRRFAEASAIAPTLQAALDDWNRVEGPLQELSSELSAGAIDGRSCEEAAFAAPLPRAYEWIDGSAYLNHVRLVRKARNAEPPATLETDPLVYQGGSGRLLGHRDPIPLGDSAWGLDFEGEICVILGDTPEATPAAKALEHVRLITICNDVSLRGLIPGELAKSFGFFQSKPATAFAPFAVTPDEFGDDWKDGRLHATLRCFLNGEQVGATHAGPEMHFSFAELIEHVTKTRALTAGTILGSGTVSNEERATGISCLAEQRMIEIIESGEASTPFMKVGDRVRIFVESTAGEQVCGIIDQEVVAR